jgi:hypothetical protein
MSYTVQYINKYGFVPAPHRSHRIESQQFLDNLENCLRKEFDEKINNTVPLELIERIDSLEEENKELRKEYDQKLKAMENQLNVLKQALAETLAALAAK